MTLRYALRALRKSPAVTAMAMLTLALGIGANTAIFTVIRSVLLRPLGFKEPRRLAVIWQTSPQANVARKPTSYPNFADWRDQSHSFESMTAFARFEMTLNEPEAERVPACAVSQGYFQMLGVQAARGRLFSPDDYSPGRPDVVVISSAAWDKRFGRDPGVVGRTIRAGNSGRVVIGILPSLYRQPALGETEKPPEFWAPGDFTNDIRGMDFLTVMARLKPGLTMEQARTEMSGINRRLAAQHGADTGFQVRTVSVSEVTLGQVQRPLWLLLGAVGLLLLGGCVNVANLLLARAIERLREFSIRAALGCSRARLFRQVVTEGLLLSAGGGLLGILLAKAAVHWLAFAGSGLIPRSDEVRLDAPVLLFTLVISCLTAVGFGSVPALIAARADLNKALKVSGRAPAAAGHTRLRAALVVSEVAVTLVLLVGAGLMLRSFGRVLGIQLGFSTQNILTAEVRLPSRKSNDEATTNFLRELLDRLRSLPGVEAAGAAGSVPLTFNAAPALPFQIEGRPAPRPGELQEAALAVATPGYFRAMRIPLRRGRLIEERDGRNVRPVALINEALARRYFPNEDPLGKHVGLGGDMAEVIGIVGDVRDADMLEEPKPQIYNPHAQRSFPTMTLTVRTAGDPSCLVPAVRRELRAMDKTMPLSNISTAEQLHANALAKRRFALLLVGAFALLALVLTAVGIYGVISCLVAQRTQEIGIRMALGATSNDLLALFVRQGLLMTAGGLAVGVPAALAGTALLSSLLYGVPPTDPLTFGAVILLFLAVAFVASYLPTRRAARLDPLLALRSD